MSCGASIEMLVMKSSRLHGALEFADAVGLFPGEAIDTLRGRADVVVAVDISGEPAEGRSDIPNPWECLLTTVLVMGSAITAEKLKHVPPELMIRPKVGSFRTLDFMQASAILRAAEPAKAEIKQHLQALLG